MEPGPKSDFGPMPVTPGRLRPVTPGRLMLEQEWPTDDQPAVHVLREAHCGGLFNKEVLQVLTDILELHRQQVSLQMQQLQAGASSPGSRRPSLTSVVLPASVSNVKQHVMEHIGAVPPQGQGQIIKEEWLKVDADSNSPMPPSTPKIAVMQGRDKVIGTCNQSEIVFDKVVSATFDKVGTMRVEKFLSFAPSVKEDDDDDYIDESGLPSGPRCPQGHGLQPYVTRGGDCDRCSVHVPRGGQVMDCSICSWWICKECSSKEMRASKLSLTEIMRSVSPADRTTFKRRHWTSEVVRFPDSTPWLLLTLFAGLGALPSGSIRMSLQLPYMFYRRVMIPVALILGLLLRSYDLAITALVLHHPVTMSELVILVGLAFGLIPAYVSFCRELGLEGSTFSLICHNERRGYSWSPVCLLAVFQLFMVIVGFAVLFLTDVQALSGDSALTTAASMTAESWAPSWVLWLYFVVKALWLPVHCVLWAIVVAVVVMPAMFSHFYRHELLWYASGLADTLENKGLELDPLPALKNTETLITNRLRTASRTWVRHCLLNLVFFCGIFLDTVMRMVSAPGSQPLWSFGLVLSLLFAALLIITIPLAGVAETFEYDVLRALNNPIVIHCAQKYFGQQLIPHLHTLEWGFRVGGTVLNMRLVMQAVTAVFVTSVTTLSQAALSRIGPLG